MPRKSLKKDQQITSHLGKAAGDGCPVRAQALSAPRGDGTSGSREDSRRAGERRIEVRVTHKEDGSRHVVLQDLSYGAGIGWYPQKTIRLDPRQVEALMGALCCARQSARESQDPKGKKGPKGKNCPQGSQETPAKKIIRLENFRAV